MKSKDYLDGVTDALNGFRAQLRSRERSVINDLHLVKRKGVSRAMQRMKADGAIEAIKILHEDLDDIENGLTQAKRNLKNK